MSTADLISSISSIAILSAALIALFALFELYRQRKLSYRPELCIARKKVFLKTINIREFNFAREWDNNQEKLNFRELSMVNIGLGTANTITATWLFNLDEIISTTNKKMKLANLPISAEKCFIDEVKININFNEETSIYEDAPAGEYTYDYLMPTVHNQNTINLKMPTTYTIFIELYSTIHLNGGFQNNDKWDLPKINLKLNYYDIGGKLIKKYYTITPRIKSMSSSGNQNKFENSGTIEVDFIASHNKT